MTEKLNNIDCTKTVSQNGNSKQDLFEEWLLTHPNASWEQIAMGLRRVGIRNLSFHSLDEIQIQEDTVRKLSELHRRFSKLSFECEKALKDLVQSGKLSLSDLALRINKERDIYGIEENLVEIKTVENFLLVISNYYHFLNYDLLVTIAEQFLDNTDLLQNLQINAANVDAFMDTTEIQCLQRTLEATVKKSKSEVPITIRVYQAWKRQKIGLVNVLLGVLSKTEIRNIPKLFRIIEGSLIIILLVSRCISLLLIEHSKHKIQFMKLTGIISLQIGDTYILQDEGNHTYTFEQGLIEATEVGNYEAVQFLLQQVCVDINAQTKPDTESIARIKEEADKYYTDKNKNIIFKRDAGTTTLMIACCNGDTEILQLLIKNNANPNLQTNTGWTALMYAAILGKSEILNILLQHKADVNIKKSSNGDTALMYACARSNIQVVKLLTIKYWADINSKSNNGATALFLASQNGHLPVVEHLLQEKANPNTPMNDGATPLYIASENGHLPVVEQLLKKKADPNTQRNDGSTALFIASQNGHLPVVKRLLQEKANSNTPRNDGATPLHGACFDGHLPVVELLLQEKAYPNTRMNNGATPLLIASENGHLPVVKRLLLEKATPNSQAVNGLTPLMIASYNGHSDVVQFLLTHNADPNIKTKTGLTALELATAKGHDEVVSVFKNL